jgi:phosphopantetheinyl transferase
MAVAVATQSPGVGIDVQEINESVLEIATEFSTDEELKLVAACTGFMKLTALTSIWTIKEASRKAAGPELCSMKELILEKAQACGEYIIAELYHQNMGHIKSVAFQSKKYVFAVSRFSERKDAVGQGNN